MLDIRKVTMFGGTALLVCGLLLAPSWQATGHLKEGHELFKTHCSSCHGEDGKGVKGIKAATINNEGLLKIASDEYLLASMRHGRPDNKMPAFSTKTFPDEKAQDIIKYIRSWRPEIEPVALASEKITGDLTKGEATYKMMCAACHGQKGEGGIGASLVDAGLHGSATDEFLLKSITTGRPGTAMIAYPDSPEIRNIVPYLRSIKSEPVEEKAEDGNKTSK